ncbi:MAG: type VI secretion system membrane subunit TssM, partial [Candidatus Competibacteraceae bacterium]|nr:type VI secretion system membrane subunit TssM [Candidatus Competibacteraceae bacterium]
MQYILQPWLPSLLGVSALSVLIWYIGPLISIAGYELLGPTLNRVLLITLLFLLWGLYRLWQWLKARRANRQMAAEIATADPAAAGQEEVKVLRQRLEEALGVLKRARSRGKGGGHYLYQRPWYILIGPPGAGKTTALLNSGLKFPLADRFGRDALEGVGGTRNCDWWFTDEAVLLDTAGRYTTQDSEQAVDKTAWTGFLSLLKKYRRRRPINGVMVAVSLADLLELPRQEVAAHARAIRQRIQELHQTLGIRFPIYVLLTKTDLIAGFSEFFDNLGREGREQVWGITFPLEDAQTPQGAVARFDSEFAALEQRLNDRLTARLQEERDPRRRDLIFTFPSQFAALGEPAKHFLDEAFRPNAYEERPLLRGVYFTSGTQEGTPIDRLLGSLASTFRVDRLALTSASGAGRSYFLQRLLDSVIFREAELAGINMAAERRRRLLRLGALGGLALITVALAAAWAVSYNRNQNYIRTVQAQTLETGTRLAELQPGQRDMLDALPALNAARAIPGADPGQRNNPPLFQRLGLYQGEKLGAQAQRSYQRLLHQVLLPRLMLALEAQMQAQLDDPQSLYQTLKVYLMLGDADHLEPDTVHDWVVSHWNRRLPREVSATERAQLQAHLEALLAHRLIPLPLAQDEALIRHARDVLNRQPLAQRIYVQLQALPAVRELPPFRVSEAAGQDAPRVFVRTSGRALSEGIPGLYTREGYRQAFTASLRLIEQLAAESWVLGQAEQLSGLGLVSLRQRVLALYARDYAGHYRELLEDLTIVPFQDLRQAVDTLSIISGPGSPLVRLLAGIRQETTLTQADDPAGSQPTGSGNLLQGQALVEDTTSSLTADTPVLSTAKTRQIVEQLEAEFQPLHQELAGENPPLDNVIALLNELYVQMNAIFGATDRGGAIPEAPRRQAEGLIDRLQLQAERKPLPLNRWLAQMADDSARLILGGVRAQLNGVWTAEVLPFFRQGLAGRYPLTDSAREATLEDFGRFFGFDGLVDGFFKTYLAPYVDPTRDPWAWRSSEAEALGIAAEVLVQFQRAAAIRDAFFRPGTQMPSARFTLTPVDMDRDASQFLLDVGGQQ